MKIGILLEALIEIAQVSKTDFAINMNMTPSGLSKILTGKRLPVFKEKRAFIEQAARSLAEAIYEDRCYLKFPNVFPVIYDFRSMHELELFLTCALEYTLEKDFAIEHRESQDYPEKEASFLGKKNVLNVVCVVVSHYVVDSEEEPLAFFSALPILNRVYYDVFSRIRIISPRKEVRSVFHHCIDIPSFEQNFKEYNLDILSSIVAAEKYVDLHLWETRAQIPSPFLYLDERFLMIFSVQIDNMTPLVTLITNKSHLSRFFNHLQKREATKISYDEAELSAALEENPEFLSRTFAGGVKSVYSFISPAWLVHETELASATCSPIVKRVMMAFFSDILTEDVEFFISIEAMREFYATGKIHVPMVGTVCFPKEERIPFLQRVGRLIEERGFQKIKVVESSMPKVSLACTQEISAMYLTDEEDRYEKIHFFNTNAIGDLFAAEVSDSSLRAGEFNAALWRSYIENLAR